MVQIDRRSSSILNALSERVVLKIAAGVGSVALLAGCASNTEASSPTERPSVSQSANTTPTPTETVPSTSVDESEVLLVDHADTEIDSVDEAVSILNISWPINLKRSSVDYEVLIDAASGDSSGLNALGITANDLYANYKLSELFIKNVAGDIKEAKSELPNWFAEYPDFKDSEAYQEYSAVSIYDDARATKYLLGSIIEKYQNGELDIASETTQCTEDSSDMISVSLPNGVMSNSVAPPLSLFRFSYITEQCELDQTTTALVDLLRSDTTSLTAPSNSPATQSILEARAEIMTLNDEESKAIIKSFSK